MRNFLPLILALFFISTGYAQDTFSIMAVDPATGEVGSAGASCIDDSDCGGCGGAIIINDLIPGVGGIDAQATVCLPNINLVNGLGQMESGASAQGVLDYLLSNDACTFGDTSSRQYGIVRLDGNNMPQSASFTGSNCLDYKNHITGPNYSIQGNILLGQEVLDSMEARFLRATGSLANRLMEALQGANIPGADSRCLSAGISSKSAFLRVARPDDDASSFYLDLNVPEVPTGVEPIDSLQSLFDEWQMTTPTLDIDTEPLAIKVYPNPAKDQLLFDLSQLNNGAAYLQIFDTKGQLLQNLSVQTDQMTLNSDQLGAGGLYIFRVLDKEGQEMEKGKFMLLK